MRARFVLLVTSDYKKDEYYPKFQGTTQVGDTYYLYKMLVIVCGIMVHTAPIVKKLLYFSKKIEAGKLNSNHTLNYLLHAIIHHVPSWVCNIRLLMDNAGKSNKNKYIITLAACLININRFKSVHLSFMIPGHTKFEVDNLFANVTKALSNQNIFDISMYKSLVNTLSNKDCKTYVEIMDSKNMYNLKSVFENLSLIVKNIKKTYNFLLYKDDNIKELFTKQINLSGTTNSTNRNNVFVNIINNIINTEENNIEKQQEEEEEHDGNEDGSDSDDGFVTDNENSNCDNNDSENEHDNHISTEQMNENIVRNYYRPFQCINLQYNGSYYNNIVNSLVYSNKETQEWTIVPKEWRAVFTNRLLPNNLLLNISNKRNEPIAYYKSDASGFKQIVKDIVYILPNNDINVIIKQYMHSKEMLIKNLTNNCKKEVGVLKILNRSGFLKKFTQKQFHNFCLNYKYVDPEFWPNGIVLTDYEIYEEEMHMSLTEDITEYEKSLDYIHHQLNLKQSMSTVSEPNLNKYDLKKFDWIVVTGKKATKTDHEYWLALFLKYTNTSKSMIYVQWLNKISEHVFYLMEDTDVIPTESIILTNINVVVETRKNSPHKQLYFCNITQKEFEQYANTEQMTVDAFDYNLNLNRNQQSTTSMLSTINRRIAEQMYLKALEIVNRRKNCN